MCHATREILWQPAEEWVGKQNRGASLALRVGSGQATYHRYDLRRHEHLITYGQHMVAAKHQPMAAEGWLSTREIRRRAYFAGEVSVLNLLAHTCCHEFAHLLQHCAGQRYYGSVHNRHFYQVLDELHNTGAALAVRRYLGEEAAKAGLPLPDRVFANAHRMQPDRPWQVGDQVCFGEGRHEQHGQVIRVNRKTCTVAVSQPSRDLRYRVPVALLRHRH